MAPLNYTNVCEITLIDVLYPATNFTAQSCSCVLDVCTASLTPTMGASGIVPFTFQYRIGSVDVGDPAVTKWTDYRDYKLTIEPINNAPTIALTKFNDVVIPDPLNPIDPNDPAYQLSILEGEEAFMDIDIAPGGFGYESTQTLVLSVTTDSPDVFPEDNE